jgi:hypothetical protein
MKTDEHTRFTESNQSLWLLALSPAVWSVHFLTAYVTAAVWCAKLPTRAASLWTVRLAIAAYTVVALGLIAVVGYRAYRRHTTGASALPHDADTPADRHRFLGFATLLLSGLSAIGVIYSVLPALFIRSCE